MDQPFIVVKEALLNVCGQWDVLRGVGICLWWDLLVLPVLQLVQRVFIAT